jgi:hypothetical protein
MPTPTFRPLPTSLPGGTWDGIRWTRVVNSRDPHWLVADGRREDATDSGWATFGWSHGYIAFDTVVTINEDYSWTAVTNTAQSLDGVSWTPGGSLGQRGGNLYDDDPLSSPIAGIVEGAGGLLVYAVTPVMCSWPTVRYAPIAASRDGWTWTAVTQPLGSIQVIDGAGAGYIALGSSGVFTSIDGLAWTRESLTGKAFARLDLAQSGTVAEDGFVFSGVTFGSDSAGCGVSPRLLNPTLWFSSDAKSWTKIALPGWIPGHEVWLDVCRSGRLVVADERAGSESRTWVSTDGRTWSVSPVDYLCGIARSEMDHLRGGGREIFVDPGQAGPATITLVNDNLSETNIAQSGDVPDWEHVAVAQLGPAGIVASSGDGTLYFGVPLTE